MNEKIKAINKAMGEEPTGESMDNSICFWRNSDVASVDFSQGRYITKIRRLAEKYPDECKIILENKDGSVIAQVPRKWIKVSPPKKIEMSDERKAALSERMKRMIEDRKSLSSDKT